MPSYAKLIEEKQKVIGERIEWAAINAEYAVRMIFRTVSKRD